MRWRRLGKFGRHECRRRIRHLRNMLIVAYRREPFAALDGFCAEARDERRA